MPVQIETPLDARSGTPLLIAPDPAGRVPRVVERHESNCGLVVNTQHVYHPWDQATGSDSLVMLHNAAGQEVLVDDHDEYHAHYAGPPIPSKPRVRLQKTFLHLGGLFPETVLDFSRGSPRQRKITDPERERFRTSGEIRVIAPDVVRHHVGSMILADPGLAELNPNTVSRFLALRPEESPADATERDRLTALLLRQTIQPLVAPVAGVYKRSFNERLLSADAPLDPARMVVDYLLHSPKATRAMAQKLAMVLVGLREV